MLARGIAEVTDGAVGVFLDKDRQQPPCLVRKRDGAFLYSTSDLATIKHRMDQFHPDLILYVVGQPQSFHFQQLFEVARRWGYTNVEFVHVSFGTILDSTGRPFRTRAGGTVGAGFCCWICWTSSCRADAESASSRKSSADRFTGNGSSSDGMGAATVSGGCDSAGPGAGGS